MGYLTTSLENYTLCWQFPTIISNVSFPGQKVSLLESLMADMTFDPTKTRIVALATETEGFEPSLPPELASEVLEFSFFLIHN